MCLNLDRATAKEISEAVRGVGSVVKILLYKCEDQSSNSPAPVKKDERGFTYWQILVACWSVNLAQRRRDSDLKKYGGE